MSGDVIHPMSPENDVAGQTEAIDRLSARPRASSSVYQVHLAESDFLVFLGRPCVPDLYYCRVPLIDFYICISASVSRLPSPIFRPIAS